MAPSTIPSTQFATRYFDAWREDIAVVFDVEPPHHDVAIGFGASVADFQFGDMVVTGARLEGTLCFDCMPMACAVWSPFN